MVNITDDKIGLNLKRTIDDSYEIVFGNGIFNRIAAEVEEKYPDRNYAIITDSNVLPLHGLNLLNAFNLNRETGPRMFSFEAGEEHKTIDSCMKIMGEMSENKFGRDTVILALGGGVTGDMSGFIAAIFNRGIPYVQIPTTVLAQADSAVGGKTGVDTAYGKNLVGAFKQPDKVYVDVATLATLPLKELRNGLAETIKHAIIQDATLFQYLDNNMDRLLGKDLDSLLYIAQQNCRIKGTVVEIDPNEKGLRRILNYGHTAGHAVEKLSNYKLGHGECVSIGMMIAGRIANHLGYFSSENLEIQEQILVRAGLPVKLPSGMNFDDIIKVTQVDKKAKGGMARYCLPNKIGGMADFNGSYATFVDEKVVRKSLEESR